MEEALRARFKENRALPGQIDLAPARLAAIHVEAIGAEVEASKLELSTMAKRANTESPATRRSQYEIDRNEAHAASQAASNKRRIDRNAPRREDMDRAAYYALLMLWMLHEQSPDEDGAGFRDPFIKVLVRAGSSREASEASFDSHVRSLFNDLDAWLAQRWYAEGRCLGDRRGRYISLKQGETDGQVVRLKALSAFLNANLTTVGSSAADKE